MHIKKIEELSSYKLNIYSVLLEGEVLTEYEKFDLKIPEFRKSHPDEIKQLVVALDRMKMTGPKE